MSLTVWLCQKGNSVSYIKVWISFNNRNILNFVSFNQTENRETTRLSEVSFSSFLSLNNDLTSDGCLDPAAVKVVCRYTTAVSVRFCWGWDSVLLTAWSRCRFCSNFAPLTEGGINQPTNQNTELNILLPQRQRHVFDLLRVQSLHISCTVDTLVFSYSALYV